MNAHRPRIPRASCCYQPKTCLLTPPDANGEARECGEPLAFFRIASPGGSANDGIAIGRWLRDHKNVRIIVNGACYSACSAAILYAGPGRITITAGGEIGLHQASNRDTGRPAVAFTTKHARALQALGLPTSAADAMIRTSPDDIYIMTPT